jgi:hypothetical protein
LPLPRRRPNCHRLRSVGILDPPTSQPRALFRPRETGEHTLADHGTLELSERTHHLEHSAACWWRRIESLPVSLIVAQQIVIIKRKFRFLA